MTDEDDYKWMVGILNGFGECFWEEGHAKIRKITRIIHGGDGNIGMMKAILGGVMRGFEEIPTEGMVVFSAGATAEMQTSCRALWGNIIKPVNGAPRFKLEK